MKYQLFPELTSEEYEELKRIFKKEGYRYLLSLMKRATFLTDTTGNRFVKSWGLLIMLLLCVTD